MLNADDYDPAVVDAYAIDRTVEISSFVDRACSWTKLTALLPSRSEADTPEIDGVVRIAMAGNLRPGDWADVEITGAGRLTIAR